MSKFSLLKPKPFTVSPQSMLAVDPNPFRPLPCFGQLRLLILFLSLLAFWAPLEGCAQESPRYTVLIKLEPRNPAAATPELLQKAQKALQDRLDKGLQGKAEVRVADTLLEVRLTDPQEDRTTLRLLASDTSKLYFLISAEEVEPGTMIPAEMLVNVVMTQDDIEEAHAGIDSNTGVPRVSIVCNKEGAEKQRKYTAANIGRYLLIVWNGKVLANPLIAGTISGGEAEISGIETKEDATILAACINSKPMPLPLVIVEERLLNGK